MDCEVVHDKLLYVQFELWFHISANFADDNGRIFSTSVINKHVIICVSLVGSVHHFEDYKDLMAYPWIVIAEQCI